MSTQSVKENPMHKEGGFTLLGAVFVASLVMGIGALGILAMTKNSSTTVYGENAANQARTAALMGINALTQYTQQQYTQQQCIAGDMSGIAAVPVGTAVTQSMGAHGNAPLANVQAAVIANTFYNPPVVSLNVRGLNSSLLPQQPNRNGAIFVQSTGRAGPYAETARAVLTLQQNKASGASVPTQYDIFARGTATFNGGVTGPNTTIGVGGTATVNGGSTIGNLDANKVALNGTTTFTRIRAENSFTPHGTPKGTVQLGNNNTLPTSGNGVTYQSLTKQETQQLNKNITQTPVINAAGLQKFAGLQFTVSNNTGMITVSTTEAALLNQSLPNTSTPIVPGDYTMGTYTGKKSQQQTLNQNQIYSLSRAVCGGKRCLTYSSGAWSVGGGFASGFAAFLYVQGSLTVHGQSGTASAPLYLTIAASNLVKFNASTYIKPYATYPNLCTSTADPVCTGQTPNSGLVGLSIVSGSTSGGSSGINLNSHSGIYGSIASIGNITIHGNSNTTVNGRIVTSGNLTMDGRVGALVNGAQSANFGGGSPPPSCIVAIRWLRWM
jgi:Tfp pilus assembly protein PilV